MANRRSRLSNKEEEALPKVNRKSFRELGGIFRYVWPYKWPFVFGLIFLVLSTGTTFLFLNFIMELIGAVTTEDPEWYQKLTQIAIYIGIALIAQAGFSFLRIYLFAQVTQRSLADIRMAIYRRLLEAKIAFFEERRVGELTSRLTADVAQLETTIQVTLAEFLRQVLILIGGVAYLFFLSINLTFVMLATFPVAIVIAMLVGRYIRKIGKKAQDELAEANVVVEETLHAIRNVKSFVNEAFEFRKFRFRMDKVVEYGIKAANARGVFAITLIVAVFGGISFVLFYGAAQVGDGALLIDELVGFLFITIFVGASIAGLGDVYGQIQKAIGASERIREIMNEEQEWSFQEEEVVEDIPAMEGEITFDSVVFHYPTRPDMQVLKGISMEVAAGEKIALVGHSGAGKSTIAQLLLRLYDIQDGQLLIDGNPIQSYTYPDLRRNVGIVPQEVMLFGGTIRENIAYGRPNATDEEILHAAEQANAWEFIKQFPEGLDTIVGERGVKLSGGQRQRVAIARAILKDPVILILDEATSSLDAESEHLVQSALNQLMEGRTTVIIAHRLSTIRQVDRIYVLDDGQIVESGSHLELQASGGAYSHLLRLQLEAE